MNALNLDNYGVVAMDAEAIRETDGGSLPGWLKKLTWGYIAGEAISHWDEIEKGFASGYASSHR